jgi:outer membrane protein insertion porin family
MTSQRLATMRQMTPRCTPWIRLAALTVLAIGFFTSLAPAQQDQPPATAPPPPASTEPSPAALANERGLDAAADLTGRTVENVRIEGNTHVPTAVLRELIRTREGEKFDPATVVEDYQRIFERMKTFANVEARVQPTEKGVIVIFIVSEQKQISEIRYIGNKELSYDDLRKVVDLRKGQAIEMFRISQARQAIEKLYRDKNYPFAHVDVNQDEITTTGDVVFRIIEGPRVRIRKVDFIGVNNFTVWRLKDQIKTGYYIFIFRDGAFDAEQVDQDVIALESFYHDKGFFDARVGRKLSMSPDMHEMQVTFLVDEGPRYTVNSVEFRGIRSVTEGALRKQMKMLEGIPFDQDGVDADKRAIVRVYSKAGGFIYEELPGMAPNPDYLQINVKQKFLSEPGKVDLIYEISEGKQYRLGRILVKGNTRTQDKVIFREMRMRPGQVYNSAEVQDATDRLRGTPYFSSVSVTTIGDDPGVRDLLVEVEEAHTASISAGIGVNSNGGFGGQLSYEQKNFDIANPPASWSDIFSDRAWTGAGQDFVASFSPGTEGTDARVGFTEPYLFDQPYSLSVQGYLQDRIRDVYDDDRLGSTYTIGQQFNYIYSASFTLRIESVHITDVTDPTPEFRSLQILNAQGYHLLTSAGEILRRDTTNHGPVTYEGTDTSIGFEQGNALGGQVPFNRLIFSFNDYASVGEDLLGRRVVLNSRLDEGWDPIDPPFYERFYAGGFGTVRGFAFRGISPRDGPSSDAIGGAYTITGNEELGFPLAEDFLRGDIFVDYGDVEPQFHYGVIRTSVGFGFRLTLPFFGQTPLALDFGFPIIKNSQDSTQVVSFSFGISR